jgi:hypothetical protein
LQIKNEIKLLYKKKHQPNKELCYTHMQIASTWKSIWNSIEQSVNRKLQDEIKTIHEKQQRIYPNYKHKQKKNTSRKWELPEGNKLH